MKDLIVFVFLCTILGATCHQMHVTEVGSCFKDQLYSRFTDAMITCDTDALNPAATRCDVTLDCGENYNRQSQTLICLDGTWEGEVQCRPRSDLVEGCQFDIDEFGVDASCPFTFDEMTKYYLELVDKDIDVAGRRKRSLRRNRRRSCRYYCKRSVKCTVGMGQASFRKCLSCRMGGGCRSGGVQILSAPSKPPGWD